MFKRLFGGQQQAPTNALAVVRNITVGRTVSLDPLAWRRLGDQTRFSLDRDVLDITAQGLIALEDGTHVHRFYTDDDLMLQALSDDAEGQDNYDFSLFIPWTSAYPPGERERRLWKDRLSEPVFRGGPEDLPDYPRFWFADSDARQPPVTLWESVWDDRAATVPYSKIFQTCMLYARDLTQNGDLAQPGDLTQHGDLTQPGEVVGRELMLALEMQPEDARGKQGDLSHEIMIGIPLEMAEFRA